MHDLYKLQVSNALRYIGFQEGGEHKNPRGPDGRRQFDQANWTYIEHCHFFHTIDTKGSPQNKCTTINGHWHDIILVEPATDDSPAVYKCSGPKKLVRDKVGGEWINKVVDVPFDDHTHDLEYLRSEVLKPRKISEEAARNAAQFIAATVMPEPAPVAGIIG